MHEFCRNTRECIDVLLIDDVQFLAGKESTQDELFHTFNTLHENHKQIALTADREPQEIAEIADRLRARFASGRLADIAPSSGLDQRLATPATAASRPANATARASSNASNRAARSSAAERGQTRKATHTRRWLMPTIGDRERHEPTIVA